MMRIRQRPLGAHRLKSQHKQCSRQQHSQYLEPDMVPQGHSGIPVVKPCQQYGQRYNQQESYGGKDAMAFDYGAVARHVSKAVAHS
jgi:hypothetical protein